MSPDTDQGRDADLRDWYKYFVTQEETLRKRNNGNLVGKYFVIREKIIVGQYDKFDTAYRASTEQYPDGRFIIQQLLPSDQTEFILVTA